MSDDAKVSTRARKIHYYIANPGPESDGSEDDNARQNGARHAHHRKHQLPPTPPTPSQSYTSPYQRPLPPSVSTPLTTNLPPNRGHQNQLSSESSSGSPAVESTPPPSTPGISAPPISLSVDGAPNYEPVIVDYIGDRDGPQTPSSRNVFIKSKPPLPSSSAQPRPIGLHQPRHLHGSQHSNISPTSPTPESIIVSPSLGAGTSTSDKVLILVTSDSERYQTVDITGAQDPAFIRERIFTKLLVWDEEEQSQYSIYQTQIGAFAIGEALTDERLFNLCREQGDPKGSLLFFVSHSCAPVHEQGPHTYNANPYKPISPIVNTIPPVLPYNNSNTYAPLRPRRRSRSRHGSISSASERFPPEVGAGYEASVSDDLEHYARDLNRENRNTIRPPPINPSVTSPGNVPPSPRGGRRPSGPLPRPRSPVNRTAKRNSPSPNQLHDRARGQSPEASLNQDKHANMPPPIPHTAPPLSPNRATYATDDNILTPSARSPHVRSGSDTVAERERALRVPEGQLEEGNKKWRQLDERLNVDRTRDSPNGRMRQQLRPNEGLENLSRTGSWVVVDKVQPPAPPLSGPHSPSYNRTPSRHRASPQRYKGTSPYSGRTLTIPAPPRNPPPTPPVGTSEREPRNITPSQPAGQQVPAHWPVLWKGAGKGDPKLIPASNAQWNRLTKMDKARSHGDLRAAAYNHPTSLQPGRRPKNHLPMANRPTGGSGGREDTYATVDSSNRRDVNGSSLGLPKSYEAQRSLLPTGHPPRNLAPQSPSSHLDFSPTSQNQFGSRGQTHSPSLSSPSQELNRPQSALGDNLSSPSHRYPRQLQSPIQSSNAESPQEPSTLRSPRTVSPARQAAGGLSIRLNPIVGSYGERPSDTYGGIEIHRTPPRSPVSPRSPQPPLRERYAPKPSSVSENPQRPSGSSQANITDTESTLKPGAHDWIRQMFDDISVDHFSENKTLTTVPVQRPDVDIPASAISTISVKSPLTPHSESSVLEDDSDSDKDTNSIWQKPPNFEELRPGPRSPRPPLTVQTSPPTRLPTPPLPPLPPLPSLLTPPARPAKTGKGPRGSTFTDMHDTTWAPRPPPEDVYDRLEEFFPNHDLDKPVIEASSGGTSPTTAEYATIQPPVISNSDKSRVKGKKSIRIVAEEHKKRIDRNSRAESSSFTNVLRKRSTKLWGSRLEEVTPALAKAGMPPHLPDSPSGGPKPIFKWVRGELIGRGTYGRVYLALNATTGEMIAVKQVEIPRTASDKNDSRQVSVVQALKLESETLKDLDHPNIVQYLGFEETPNFLSIFLEYVPGGSVGSCLLKHGKFDEQVVKSFTGQILGGLEYLHSRNILHRDLKADNILVETTGVCKISDFGISKRTDEISGDAHTAMQGTVFWMAPEVINTRPKGYNFKIDIWSVGCVVLEMWAGSRPWMGDEAVAVMFKLYQSKQPPPVPEDVVLSSLADDFRRKCFAINPEERPTAAELRKHSYLTLSPDWVFTGFK